MYNVYYFLGIPSKKKAFEGFFWFVIQMIVLGLYIYSLFIYMLLCLLMYNICIIYLCIYISYFKGS